MVRRIRDKTLESRSARRDKPVRKTPVLVSIGRGLSIGYRRNETAGTWVFRKVDGSRLYAPPDTRTQLSTTAWSATDLSACPFRGPDAKPTVDLQGRTVPLYLNPDRSGEQPAVTDLKPDSVVPATIGLIVSLPKVRITRIVTGRPSPMSSICDRLYALAPPARPHRLDSLRTPQSYGSATISMISSLMPASQLLA